jgi:hypothetical protein
LNIYRTLFVVSCALSTLDSFGQILIGPVLGGQATFVKYDNKANYDLYKTRPYLGFHAGASISFRVRKSFFLQTSILYSQKGKTMNGKQDQMFTNSSRYRYIDMPILYNKEYKFKFRDNHYYKVQFGVGPLISYWLGGNGTLKTSELNENGINPPNYDLRYHITFGKDPEDVVKGEMNIQNPNRIQLGMNFSAGLILEPLGSDQYVHKFAITANYSFGHSFLSPQSKGDFGLGGQLNYKEDLRIRMQAVSLSVSYFVDLRTEDRKKGKSTSKIKRK